MSRLFEVMKKLYDFKGRTRRTEYWLFILYIFLFLFLALFLDIIIDSPLIITLIYILFTLPAMIAVSVRRMHDTGRSGAWFFVNFVPYIGQLWFFILTLFDSEYADNQYGPCPKAMPQPAGSTPGQSFENIVEEDKTFSQTGESQ